MTDNLQKANGAIEITYVIKFSRKQLNTYILVYNYYR